MRREALRVVGCGTDHRTGESDCCIKKTRKCQSRAPAGEISMRDTWRSPACLFAEERRGNIWHLFTRDDLRNNYAHARGILLTRLRGDSPALALFFLPRFLVLAGSLNAREIRLSRGRKPVDEEKEKKIPFNVKPEPLHLCVLLSLFTSFSRTAVQMCCHTHLCFVSAHVGASSEWVYWSLNPASLVFLNSLMSCLFILSIFSTKPSWSFDHSQ